MEVDSVHAVIERALRNQNVYSPAGYVNIIRNAKNKQPKYKIKYLDFSFLHEFKAFSFYTSKRPGRVSGDNCVNQICQLRYSDHNSYKLRHSTDEWSSLPQRINRINAPLQSLYTSQIPLKRAKWNDLQSLKSVIPKDNLTYYDNLPKL